MNIKYLLLSISASILSFTASASPIVSRDTCIAMDCRVYRLQNGIKVMAKQTTYSPRHVVVRGWSPGGLSMQYEPSTASSMLLMEEFMGIVGCEGYTPDDLRKLAKDEKIRTSVKIDKAEEVIELSTPTSLIDKGMALLCLRVMTPVAAPEAFDAWKRKRIKTAERQHTAAIRIMGDSILSNVYNHHPLAGKATVADVENISLPAMTGIIHDRFADMGDFTFYICGDFQWPDLERIITNHLAALPGGIRSTRPEVPRNIGFGYSSEDKVIQFSAATHNPLAVAYRFSHGEMPLTVRTHTVANLLGQIVIKRLNTTLKDSLGVATFIQGHCSVIYPENGTTATTFLFPVYIRTTPESLTTVEDYVDDVMQELSAYGPQADEFATALAQRSDYTAQALADNGYWLEVMAYYDRHGVDFTTTPTELSTITAADIRTFAAAVIAAPRVAITMNRR